MIPSTLRPIMPRRATLLLQADRHRLAASLARLFVVVHFLLFSASIWAAAPAERGDYPKALDSYHDAGLSVGAQLWGRIQQEPFNLLSTALFLAAIIHTFLAPRFMALAHRYQHAFEHFSDDEEHPELGAAHARRRDRLQFRAQLFHFMGEIEAVFGIWVLPLGLSLIVFKGWPSMVSYFSNTSYAEPIFVVVIMAIAASRPILNLAEKLLARAAALAGGGPAAWWFSILTIGPILGSFITEPAAMTICALLLSRRFYALKPSARLAYSTLGILFVNISVGGTLTHFAAPPVVMVARPWGWDLWHMMSHFGWKAVVGILVINVLHYLSFRGEFSRLATAPKPHAPTERPVAPTVTIAHLLFIAWTVVAAHDPPLVIFGFLIFLAFVEATERHL